MIEVRAFEPDEWQLLREVRLAALRDAPEAFASTDEHELAFDEGVWRSRLESRGFYVALDGQASVGIAAGTATRRRPPGGASSCRCGSRRALGASASPAG